ncbi:MAG: L,D-transpeptidase family protein [Holosporales bacterium]|jgi:murein L,D-transpeptidase YafK|nr:L,D-transpeptidase family protein [Holosporales bacterium]
MLIFASLCTGTYSCIASTAGPAANTQQKKPNNRPRIIDKILVEKSKRTMTLYRKGIATKTYKIALGGVPIGHKQEEGDKKTPEGVYQISFKNPVGIAGKTLLISYPNGEDTQRARAARKNPGGNICIHGLWPNLRHLGANHVKYDWTLGCIAVTDAEMEEIYAVTEIGTVIEIIP